MRSVEQGGEIGDPIPTGQSDAVSGRPSALARDASGRYLPRHGGCALEDAFRRGKLKRRDRRMLNRFRFRYALALSYPAWVSVPAPLQALVDSAIRTRLLAERYFEPFFLGEPVPRDFLPATEALRRAHLALGLPSPVEEEDLVAALARMARETSERGGTR